MLFKTFLSIDDFWMRIKMDSGWILVEKKFVLQRCYRNVGIIVHVWQSIVCLLCMLIYIYTYTYMMYKYDYLCIFMVKVYVYFVCCLRYHNTLPCMHMDWTKIRGINDTFFAHTFVKQFCDFRKDFIIILSIFFLSMYISIHVPLNIY